MIVYFLKITPFWVPLSYLSQQFNLKRVVLLTFPIERITYLYLGTGNACAGQVSPSLSFSVVLT